MPADPREEWRETQPITPEEERRFSEKLLNTKENAVENMMPILPPIVEQEEGKTEPELEEKGDNTDQNLPSQPSQTGRPACQITFEACSTPAQCQIEDIVLADTKTWKRADQGMTAEERLLYAEKLADAGQEMEDGILSPAPIKNPKEDALEKEWWDKRFERTISLSEEESTDSSKGKSFSCESSDCNDSRLRDTTSDSSEGDPSSPGVQQSGGKWDVFLALKQKADKEAKVRMKRRQRFISLPTPTTPAEASEANATSGSAREVEVVATDGSAIIG